MGENKTIPPMLQQVVDSYAFGTAGGSTYFLLKGLYNSSKGNRVDSALESAYKKAPQVAGYALFATVVFCTMDDTMEFVREKKDIWNKIAAGAAASAFLLPLRVPLPIHTKSIVLCASFAGVYFSNTS